MTKKLYLLQLLSIANLIVLSFGVGVCVMGLGHNITIANVAAVGVAMNALSAVAITPGNFGIREAALSFLAPLLNVNFGVLVQGAACYVFMRLLTSLLIATAMRNSILEKNFNKTQVKRKTRK